MPTSRAFHPDGPKKGLILSSSLMHLREELPKKNTGHGCVILPARAFDNSLFIVACNQTGENEKVSDFRVSP
jgi:predicted amidohydrolase